MRLQRKEEKERYRSERECMLWEL